VRSILDEHDEPAGRLASGEEALQGVQSTILRTWSVVVSATFSARWSASGTAADKPSVGCRSHCREIPLVTNSLPPVATSSQCNSRWRPGLVQLGRVCNKGVLGIAAVT